MAIKPPQLKAGDTIGIVALGSPLSTTVINQSITTLENMGFSVVVGDHVYDSVGFLAGTPQQRAADLMKMFENKAVSCILPTRGGVGVAGILPFLDFSVITQNPKIVSGYSDITVLLNALYEYSNLITFQSLLLLDFNPQTPAYNFNQFFAATSALTAPLEIYNPPEIPLVNKVAGDVTGPVVGGNLTSFVGSLGTPFEINTDGKILCLEETHEPINTVYRYLNHLKIAGKFDDCIGILMGECTNCEPAYGVTYNELIDEFLVPLGKPLMSNLATAHGRFKAAIPIGASVRMNVTERKLTVTESLVSP
ncbi:LD-carboxypeptidase [Paenisporosarcina macmurdoensis]|uniref:LD-carboxypeptidase n=1 Tax=Paenisporosarcina macmurdoensis TaxID=212659 RepID=A0ABW1L6W6_9BACL